MNRNMANRLPRNEKSFDVTKPVEATAGEDCFGNEWKAGHAACAVCADSDVCCIIRSRRQRKAEPKDKLDNETWATLDLSLELWLSQGERAVQEMFEFVQKQAKATDEQDVYHYVKNYLQKEGYKVVDYKIMKK
jgi:hypothetical protein